MGNLSSAATLEMTQTLTLDNADVTGMVRALQTGCLLYTSDAADE